MFSAGTKPGAMLGPIVVSMMFHPAQNRQRDIDNCQAMMKAALDGVAQALGVNDSMFRPVSSIGVKRNPACVVVTLTPSLVNVPVMGAVS